MAESEEYSSVYNNELPATVASNSFQNNFQGIIDDTVKEIREECLPKSSISCTTGDAVEILRKTVYVPFFPAFAKPGWLKNYIVGPHNWLLFEMFMSDLWAGVIVALTLIPQVYI